MLVFFLRFMRQKNGRQICVQLLQTLNILFENISNETSVCKCFGSHLHLWTLTMLIILTKLISIINFSICCIPYISF